MIGLDDRTGNLNLNTPIAPPANTQAINTYIISLVIARSME
jgi:hypothetical protein